MSDDTGADGSLLRAEDLSVSYGKVAALRGVSFSVDDGEFVAVIGPNGAGKSTLCDAISGYLDYEGSIEYAGTEVRETGHVVEDGLIYCSESRNLFGNMSVANNLELGAYRRKGNVDERREFVYDLFPVLEDRKKQLARTLSGGQQQMLAIGRALMGDPRALVLDEPTIGLAPVICDDITEALAQIHDEGVSVILLEQNVTFAMDLADRVFLLENGSFAREGPPEVLEDDEYIRDAYLGG
ncbi:ATP-binding cassette domain-containing protein [Halobellus sp. GM3]|uniref:ATP-binding cassette domain-containing protein n=1 Tax=Halobellus sp. GM3 TaxID=3458410 RepID=UPI00403E2281